MDTQVISTSAAATRECMPLDRRFALAGSIVMLIGMAIVGLFVSRQIETAVTRNAAISGAVYMESFIAPLSQELSAGGSLSPESVAKLDAMLKQKPMSEQIVSAKIWVKGGIIAFATDSEMIGRQFPPDENLRRAWHGDLNAAFDELDEDESAGERETGLPLMEVYNPIHSIETGEVISVVEFYQNATELKRDLFFARIQSFAVVGAVALLTFVALIGIVRAGSLTIKRQHAELSARFLELTRISAQNVALRRRIQAASSRAAETNERQLRRISAELHDGPAQALALASLRLNSVAKRAGVEGHDPEVVELRRSLDEAMGEIRNICRGLTLPELEGRSLAEALEMAVAAHERRTGTVVARNLSGVRAGGKVADAVLICAYRFVQEGLMNAFRHAGGRGQQVAATVCGGTLSLSVHDEGDGFDPDRPTRGSGLGLSGLRERVETIGGDFFVTSVPGDGTILTMTLALDA